MRAIGILCDEGWRRDCRTVARLAGNGRIHARVAYLHRAAADEVVVTQAAVVEALAREAGLVAALSSGSTSAARVQALKILGQHLGMFTDKVQHDVSARLADLVREARPLPVGMAPAPRPEDDDD